MSDNEIILSGSEETLKPIITLLIGINQLLESQPKNIVYGIPSAEVQEQKKFKPHVTLYFEQDIKEVAAGYGPVTGEISFRLMKEESETLTETKLKILAQKIKSKFGGSTPFVWNKGKEYWTYTDAKLGYKLQLLCPSQTEAMRVVEQVLDIQSHSPEWEKLKQNANAKPSTAYPSTPKKVVILGKSRRLPRRRPVAKVRFRYAHILVWGITQPIELVAPSRQLTSIAK